MGRKKTKNLDDGIQTRLRESLVILLVMFAIFLWISLASHSTNDPSWNVSGTYPISNRTGIVGAYLSDACFLLLGDISYALPFSFLILSFQCIYLRFFNREQWTTPWVFMKINGLFFIIISSCTWLDVTSISRELPGGIVGHTLGQNTLLHNFNILGTKLLTIAAFMIGLSLSFGVEWSRLVRLIAVISFRIWSRILWPTLSSVLFNAGKKVAFYSFSRIRESYLAYQNDRILRLEAKNSSQETIESETSRESEKIPSPPGSFFNESESSHSSKKEKEVDVDDTNVIISAPKKISHAVPKMSQQIEMVLGGVLPPIDLLDKAENNEEDDSLRPELLKVVARDIEQCLKDFQVDVKVVAIHPGPVITRYELELKAGQKASKITGLASDIARNLSVSRVRVVEVIPGKSVVGLEIPNQSREIVRLREIIESKSYVETRSSIPLVLGKDISGVPEVVDLAKMPHLLVAGTTGSGKSVGINAMLLSILFKATPEEVRFILIDPKMLELSVYEGIAHLLTPVITDMKDAAKALNWCVGEMERRYKLLAAVGVRNLAGFNRKVKSAIDKGEPIKNPLHEDRLSEAEDLEPFPNIVVIIDEFADMMMVVGKKVEELIARIAQKARAAGIHLILATQRPSVDVITGLIKANIPSRIAFSVSSKIDSRTILDQQGADQLLGHGDMLYLSSGSGIPDRYHGAFVSDDEVHSVVRFLKENSTPKYLDLFDAPKSLGFELGDFDSDSAECDELYDQAVQIVLDTRKSSISHLQRRLKIGYNRAARLIEAMEESGIVSPMHANGSREVLVPNRENDA